MRVLLVDDHALFRAGLSSLVGAWGMEVVGQAGDGLQAVALARSLKPDLVLMDINIPGISGLEATRLIKTEMPEVRVVMVSVSESPSDLFEAIRSGAEGYLLKGMSEEEFGRMLGAVMSGEPPLSPGLAAKILHEFGRISDTGDARASPLQQLTEREREVLQLAATGATNREIGATLYISENTVNFHLKHVFAKLQVRNRAQAVAEALRAGLVEQPGSDG